MNKDDEPVADATLEEYVIETSHGPSTRRCVVEHDLPYWREAAEHAVQAYNRLADQLGFHRLCVNVQPPQGREASGSPITENEALGCGGVK